MRSNSNTQQAVRVYCYLHIIIKEKRHLNKLYSVQVCTLCLATKNTPKGPSKFHTPLLVDQSSADWPRPLSQQTRLRNTPERNPTVLGNIWISEVGVYLPKAYRCFVRTTQLTTSSTAVLCSTEYTLPTTAASYTESP